MHTELCSPQLPCIAANIYLPELTTSYYCHVYVLLSAVLVSRIVSLSLRAGCCSLLRPSTSLPGTVSLPSMLHARWSRYL